MFFYEMDRHMQKLISFGQVKKIGLKKSLTLDIQVPLHLNVTPKPRSLREYIFSRLMFLLFLKISLAMQICVFSPCNEKP